MELVEIGFLEGDEALAEGSRVTVGLDRRLPLDQSHGQGCLHGHFLLWVEREQGQEPKPRFFVGDWHSWRLLKFSSCFFQNALDL